RGRSRVASTELQLGGFDRSFGEFAHGRRHTRSALCELAAVHKWLATSRQSASNDRTARKHSGRSMLRLLRRSSGYVRRNGRTTKDVVLSGPFRLERQRELGWRGA